MVSGVDKSEIAFFDLETSVPRPGQGIAILEFGAILFCLKTLNELDKYSTFVRPSDLSLISNLSDRPNGINRDAVISAPTFTEIADKVYNILHGKIWAGHNIIRFDCARIREAFAEINRPAPEPKGIIDSLPLLTQKFGRRAGDMKMATLATYFGIGQQTHRSLDDVRMNLEVLKHCATVLLLESSLPDIFTDMVEPNSTRPDPSDMGLLSTEMKREPLQLEGSNDHIGFLEPHEISIPSVSVFLARFYRGMQKIQILHKNVALQVCCRQLKVRFGISTKFVDSAGRPRLSFVVDASPSLCKILDESDNLAQRLSADSGSSSEWRPSVTRKAGFLNSPTVRLNLPTVADGNAVRWATEIYHKESSTIQRLVFSEFDIVELNFLFSFGNFVDAYFSLDTYDYQQNAGIRLVAKKLIVHTDR